MRFTDFLRATVLISAAAASALAAVTVAGASAVYTDVWASMGQEAEAQKRLKDFHGYIVDNALMSHAKPEAVFLHCLPAHRGEEVTDDVLDSDRSLVIPQAAIRLHFQARRVHMVVGGKPGWLDVLIMLRTANAVVRGRGAF